MAGERGGRRTSRVDALAREVAEQLAGGSLAAVYRERVLPQRTRRYELGATGPATSVEVLHTLLGVELKVGRRRLHCPDLATARYLAVFARIGVQAVAVPYDITKVSTVADELESAWHRTMLLAEHVAADGSDRLRSLVKTKLVAHAREEIAALGAGADHPIFEPPPRRRRAPRS